MRPLRSPWKGSTTWTPEPSNSYAKQPNTSSTTTSKPTSPAAPSATSCSAEPCSDWDIVTDGNVPQLARSLADKLAGYFVHLNDKASRIVIKHAGSETIIDIAPLKGNTIEEDLRQRDFTINAIAAPLAEIVHLLQIGNVVPFMIDPHSRETTPGRGQAPPLPYSGFAPRNLMPMGEALIDPLNGLADIQARQLKAVDDTIFEYDPLRMLRAVRLSMRYQLSIESATENLIKRDAKLLLLAAPERIHDELYAILEPVGATVQLRYLDALGLLTVLMPEFIPARGMRQPSPHYWDVLEHSLESVGALERLVAAIRQGYAGDHKGPHPTLPHPRPYGGDGGPNRGKDRPDKGEGRPGGGDGGPNRGEDRPGGGKDRSDKGEGRPGGGDLLRGGFLSTETSETSETSVPMETMETSVVPQGHPVWGTGTLPGGQVIPPHSISHRPYGHDDPFPKNLPLRDGGEDRPDKGDGGPNGKGAEPNGDQADFAELRTLLHEAEQQGIFQFASLTAPRMKLAALLHDIGKPITYSTDADGNIHFYDHPQAGIPLAQQIMTRLNASTQDRRVVQLVVAHHMRPGQLAHVDTVTPRAIRRYFVDLGPMGIHVALFSLADHIATVGPLWDEYTRRPDSSWPRHLAIVRLLLTRYIRERESILPARLVSPEELMRRLKLEPGPLIGQLLESIAEAQAEGRIHSKEEALWLAEEELLGRN